jgi:hypothetical protein
MQEQRFDFLARNWRICGRAYQPYHTIIAVEQRLSQSKRLTSKTTDAIANHRLRSKPLRNDQCQPRVRERIGQRINTQTPAAGDSANFQHACDFGRAESLCAREPQTRAQAS